MDFQRESLWKGRDARDSGGCRRNRRVRKRGHKIGNGGAGRRWLHIAGAQRGRAARRQAKRELGTLSRGGQRARTRRGVGVLTKAAGRKGAPTLPPMPVPAVAPRRLRPAPGSPPAPAQPAGPTRGRPEDAEGLGAGGGGDLRGPGPLPVTPRRRRRRRKPDQDTPHTHTAAGSETLRGMGAEGAVRRPLRYHGLGVPGPRLLVWAGTSREPSAQAEVTGERCGSSSSPREVAFLTACCPTGHPHHLLAGGHRYMSFQQEEPGCLGLTGM